MNHSPNNPILLSSSLHVDDARKAIAQMVDELLTEARLLNHPADINTVSLDQAIGFWLKISYRRLMCHLQITLLWMALPLMGSV